MKSGCEVRIPHPVRASDLLSLMSLRGNADPEVYVRYEDGKAVLYLVQRIDDGRGVGKILGSRPIPTLPEEV